MATVDITINAVNDDPIAVDDSFSTDLDTELVVAAPGLLVNDTDIDSSITVNTTPVDDVDNGTLVLAADGSFTYTPDAGTSGTDSFSYEVTALDGGVSTATVSITVFAGTTNTRPEAIDDLVTTDEDLAVIIRTSDLLANDSDADGDTLTIPFASVSTPTNGTLVDSGNGSWTYTPQANFNGFDSFTYTISDGEGTDVATVTITVNAVNDAPVAVGNSITVDEDVPLTFNAADLLFDDSDLDGDALAISNVSQPAHGSVVDNLDGTYTYIPAANYNGADVFTYTVSDGNGGSDTAQVNVTVNAVNDAPVANADSATTDEDTPLVLSEASLLANDTDLENDLLDVVSSDRMVDNLDGTWTYSPVANFSGVDSFDYVITDGTNFATGSLTITIAPVNDAPVAITDELEAIENTPLTFNVAALLNNDTDLEDDILSTVDFTQPGNGTLVDNGDGTWTYTPVTSFVGTDTFTYRISDGADLSDYVSVDVEVIAEVAGIYTYSMTTATAIPDPGVIVSSIVIDDVFDIVDLNVVLNINHTRDSDLIVELISPTGQVVELFNRIGGRGDGFINTTLDDAAAQSILNGSAPYTGEYRPVGDLSQLEGYSINGTWTLQVQDVKKKESGTLVSWSLVVERGSTLLASAAPVPSTTTPDDLTQAELDQTVDEAISRWIDSGLLDASQLAQLDELNFVIADLDGLTLGLATADTIYIDATAAGFGWFVDTTVAEDSEFTFDASGTLIAATDSDAYGRMDLLTVVSHEIGHILGIDHDSSSDLVLMDGTLDAGTRLLVDVEEDSPDSDQSQNVGSLENWWKNDAAWYQFLNNHAAKKPLTGRSFRIS